MRESNHQKCYRRDKQLFQVIEKLGVLDTEQITCLFFPGNNGLKKAQRRLKKLYQNKKLLRGRESFSEPYYYYLGKRPGQIHHQLAVSWVYVWLKNRMRSGERLHSFDTEQDYRVLRADAFVAIKNNMAKRYIFNFIELDRSENNFDKASKYNTLYSTGKYSSYWWVPLANRFPAIIIVAENERRLRMIRERIRAENSCGLEFKTYLLEQIRGECIKCQSSIIS